MKLSYPLPLNDVEGASLFLHAEYPDGSGRDELLRGAARACCYTDAALLSLELRGASDLPCVLRDVRGSETASLTLEEGVTPLDALPLGWYSLTVGASERPVYCAIFADRAPEAADTPFAMDYAAYYLMRGSAEQVESVASAARLAGVRWVRERADWKTVEPRRGEHDFAAMEDCYRAIHRSGLKNLAMLCSAPRWACEGYPAMRQEKPGGFLHHLKEIYQTCRGMAAHYGDTVEGWEIWNESDGCFAGEGADLFAAFYKAGALGLADSGAQPVKAYGGFCTGNSPSVNNYFDIAYAAGIQDYADVFNYHAHLAYRGQPVENFDRRPIIEDQSDNCAAYNPENKPVWVTESGMKLFFTSGTQRPTPEQLYAQSRYVITSTVQSLASGTDKHFWFVLAPYIEESGDFGCFSPELEPYPAMAAEAAMTAMLGRARYRGLLRGLPEGCEGHLFDTGRGDCAVIWSRESCELRLALHGELYCADMMGNPLTPEYTDGALHLTVGCEPVFVALGERCPENLVTPVQWTRAPLRRETFSVGQHVVLCPYFEDYIGTVKMIGHRIRPDGRTPVRLGVLNLNPFPVSGSVRAYAEGCTVEGDFSPVALEPMEERMLDFTLVTPASMQNGCQGLLSFDGVFNDSPCAPAVSCFSAPRKGGVTSYLSIPEFNCASNWDVRNIGNGIAHCDDRDGTPAFTVRFHPGDHWFYPHLRVSNGAAFADSRGLVFSYAAEEDTPRVVLNCFLYLDDGRNYYLDGVEGRSMSFSRQWRQAILPWSHFSLYSSQYWGNYDMRPFDPARIVGLSVGINAYTDEPLPVYMLRDAGVYFEEAMQAGERERIRIAVGADGVDAILPDVPLTGLRVTLNGAPFKRYTISANQLHIDKREFPAGLHRIAVIASRPDHSCVMGSARFTV